MRRNATSCRPLKLTEGKIHGLLHWYTVERTFAHKAKELGISERTLFRYLRGEHSPRKEAIDIDALARELMSVATDVPLETMEH
jgi:hypothetical protein